MKMHAEVSKIERYPESGFAQQFLGVFPVLVSMVC